MIDEKSLNLISIKKKSKKVYDQVRKKSKTFFPI